MRRRFMNIKNNDCVCGGGIIISPEDYDLSKKTSVVKTRRVVKVDIQNITLNYNEKHTFGIYMYDNASSSTEDDQLLFSFYRTGFNNWRDDVGIRSCLSSVNYTKNVDPSNLFITNTQMYIESIPGGNYVERKVYLYDNGVLRSSGIGVIRMVDLYLSPFMMLYLQSLPSGILPGRLPDITISLVKNVGD